MVDCIRDRLIQNWLPWQQIKSQKTYNGGNVLCIKPSVLIGSSSTYNKDPNERNLAFLVCNQVRLDVACSAT